MTLLTAPAQIAVDGKRRGLVAGERADVAKHHNHRDRGRRRGSWRRWRRTAVRLTRAAACSMAAAAANHINGRRDPVAAESDREGEGLA